MTKTLTRAVAEGDQVTVHCGCEGTVLAVYSTCGAIRVVIVVPCRADVQPGIIQGFTKEQVS